eukprot:TRINITY_DN1760_c0_g1_i7.p1 TRINITY_DN1760_c0_g1~~TRINITY_DN1760_c0_g1_i7.p1  ORF type:complete len:207 (+),score=28.14 TRINITY_DN1760_c0_g1_i7:342-962(+)
MRMCFKKAIVNKMKGQGGNNHSGYYYVGPKGIGKSTLFKTCCLISSILLPNFAPVFVDYSSNTSKELPIHQILKDALQPHLCDNSVNNIVDVASALREARRKRITLAVFLDESDVLYQDEKAWKGLHQIVTSFDHCLFMTGNECLSSFISSSQESDLTVIKQCGYILKQSLNDTKIQRRRICRVLDNNIKTENTITYFESSNLSLS